MNEYRAAESDAAAGARAEQVARASYGRLLALLTVARNRQRDVYKSSAHRTSMPLDTIDLAFVDDLDLEAIPDKRLELLFVCAHPAIDASVRTPLMLQTVLGLESRQVAAAFVIPQAAMAQRLVRAKRRIRDARIPFAVPQRQDMPARLPAVLEAAIQSAHCARARSGMTDWAALRTLYEALVALAPTLGARISLAATIGRTDGPLAGLASLDGIADAAAVRFQPAWAARAHLLALAGRADDAAAAYEKAISLTTDPVIREYLRNRSNSRHDT